MKYSSFACRTLSIIAVLLLIFTFSAPVTCNAQSKSKAKSSKSSPKYSSKSKKAIEYYEKGVLEYQYQRFQAAKLNFDQSLKADPNFIEAHFMLSETYRDMGDYEHQVESISNAVAIDSTTFVTAYYLAGEALLKLNRFSEATQWFEKYKQMNAGKKNQRNVDQLLAKAKAIQYLMEHPVPYKPRLLSENIVMKYDQYWPSLTLDEEQIVFTALLPRDTVAFNRNRAAFIKHPKKCNEDLYVSRKIDDKWTKPEPITSINTLYNEGTQTISADGQFMFFTACGREDSKGSCDIYFCRKTANGWTTPRNIDAPVNTPYWESQPCFAADGQTLYFVSNRPGGKGGIDIYKSTICGTMFDGTPIFSDPVNLGDSINSRGNEASPFIHPDNKTLYFSSDGWPGLGKLDIFVARRNADGKWTSPVNIGYPINTHLDDDGLILNAAGDMAYLATECLHPDGFRKKDVFTFEMPVESRPEPVSYIKGHVYDAVSHKPLKAQMELINLSSGEKQTDATSDAATGIFIVNLPTGNDYGLFATCKGYLYKSQNFALKEVSASSEQIVLDIPMSRIEKGQSLILKNIFFDFNSTELKEESQVELNRLASLLKSNPSMKVEIGGHTDNVGSADFNKRLSNDRAKATVDYLVKHGITSSRISFKGYGMTMPIATNDTEEGRAQNRRIEAKVIE
ncbi:MAG: OmpA family protein [Bacteroidales bacterium]|nr:OmpA family protein [Bacteroidales bacterium]